MNGLDRAEYSLRYLAEITWRDHQRRPRTLGELADAWLGWNGIERLVEAGFLVFEDDDHYRVIRPPPPPLDPSHVSYAFWYRTYPQEGET